MMKPVMKIFTLPVFLFSVVWLMANNSAVLGGKETDPRIVGGRLAKTGELPFQVSIQLSYAYIHMCGGSIVSPNHVLTAAHCMYTEEFVLLPVELITVVAGQLSLNKTDGSFWTVAKEIYVHEDYNAVTHANDIAVIKLLKTIPESNGLVRPIELNSIHQEAGTQCIVSGWGVQEQGSVENSPWLLVAKVKLVHKDICIERYSKTYAIISDGQICAANEEVTADSCQNDSGGPLVCRGVLIGVISVGIGCGDPRFPGIYADVHYYHEWIEGKMSL